MKLIIRGFLFSSSAVAVLALLPVLASRSDADNALWFGILFGLFGAGAVIAGLISNAMRAWLSVEWINRLSFVVFGICAVVLPWTMESWVACVITGLAGASWTAALSLIHISVQMAAPRWVTGRAVSIFHMANFGGMALGSWIWGVAAEHSTTQTALYLSAGGLFLGALIGVGRFALPDLVLTDLAPIDRRDDPIRRLEMDARCGPVTINIEYAIAEPDEQAFLVVMQERRRIRRRDGARRWHLSRDINCPTHWVESYQLPTWGDYMHHDRRATLADARIIDQLRHLQSTGKPPVRRCFVHQMTHRAARRNP